MRYILSLAMIFLFILLLGCSKEEELSSEPIITSNVVIQSKPPIEEFIEVEVENITTVNLCHDTDNGIIRWVSGSVFGFYDNATRFEFDDHCFDDRIVIEYYCENENPRNQSFVCKSGCTDSHCI